MLVAPSEPAYTPIRDYPPWFALFADGTRIDAAGRERHINFRDAVLSRQDALMEFGCTFPLDGPSGREHVQVRINLADGRVDERGHGLPAGAFWLPDAREWGLGKFHEPGLQSFRVIYYRQASMTLGVTAMVARGGARRRDSEGPPAPVIRYDAIELGWQAQRADGASVTCVLWVTPGYARDGSIAEWRWEWRDRY
jgi:hypothetical protein